MRLLIQRVSEASVKVDEKIVGKIDKGFLVLVGITHGDTEREADFLAKKLCNLRVFEDENGKMNLNINAVGGVLLFVSQFKLYANCNEGNRPSFTDAAKTEEAERLYDYFCNKCKEYGVGVEKGIFGADMKVSLLNDGPVTIMLER